MMACPAHCFCKEGPEEMEDGYGVAHNVCCNCGAKRGIRTSTAQVKRNEAERLEQRRASWYSGIAMIPHSCNGCDGLIRIGSDMLIRRTGDWTGSTWREFRHKGCAE